MKEIRPDWIVLTLASIVCFIYVRRQKEYYLKTLPFFFLITLAVELIGRYYKLRSINNVPIYNLYSVLQLTYFIGCLYLILNRSFIKKLIVLIPIICILNIACIQGIKVFHTYSYTVSAIIITFLCVYYYYYLFKDALVENLWKDSPFWFVTAVFSFYTISLTIISVMNYIADLPPDTIKLIRKSLLNLNSIFYFLLFIAFICNLNTRKYSPNS
jgi:hypothetical protein